MLRLVLLFVLLVFAPPLRAQAQADAEKDDVQTPADLGELIKGLPEQGVLYDVYIKITNAQGNEGVRHDKIEAKDKRLVWTRHEAYSIKESGAYDYVEEEQVFDADGTFLTKQMTLEAMSSGLTIRESLRREGGEVRRVYTRVTDGKPETSESTSEVAPLAQGAIPVAWQPLALMYHARHSHDRFVIRLGEHHWRGSCLSYSYEKSGTETIEIGGVEMRVHVYQRRERSFGAEGREAFPDNVKAGTTWMTDAGIVVKYTRKASDSTGDYIWEHEVITAEAAEKWNERARQKAQADE